MAPEIIEAVKAALDGLMGIHVACWEEGGEYKYSTPSAFFTLVRQTTLHEHAYLTVFICLGRCFEDKTCCSDRCLGLTNTCL